MADLRSSDGARASVAVERDPDLLAALRRQWLTIAIAAVLGTLLAWVYAATQPTTYQARSTLLLIAVGNETSPGGGRDRTLDVDTWATVARSTEVLQDVADELGFQLAGVRSRTTAVAAPTGDVLVLTFSAGNADAAVRGAQVYNQKFLAARQAAVNEANVERQQQLKAYAEDLREQINDLSDEIAAEERKGTFKCETCIAVLTSTQELAIGHLADTNTELATLETNAEAGQVLIDPQNSVSQAGMSQVLISLAGLLVGGLLGFIGALLRDRYDDRYSSAVEPELLGLREIARVPYAAGRSNPDALHGYNRLITRLTFAKRGQPETGRSVLLLPVESETLPVNAAREVATSLETGGRATGIAIGVWDHDDAAESPQEYWEATVGGVQELRTANDLVLVPVTALDHSAIGIGLAALVDETLLLVSDSTPMRAVQLALNDLRGVDVDQAQVVVVTGVRHSQLRSRKHA